MKVILIDIITPRTDGRSGPPSGVTVGKTYLVAEIHHDKYSIVNDKFKMSRYSKHRFEVIDDEPPLSLRDAFNQLTQEMRSRIKELEKKVQNDS